MSHGPATEWGKDDASSFKARYGAVLFIVYAAVYAAFVFVNVLSPSTMDLVWGSQNLATIWGIGLILLALVFGVAYDRLCSRAEKRLNEGATK